MYCVAKLSYCVLCTVVYKTENLRVCLCFTPVNSILCCHQTIALVSSSSPALARRERQLLYNTLFICNVHCTMLAFEHNTYHCTIQSIDTFTFLHFFSAVKVILPSREEGSKGGRWREQESETIDIVQICLNVSPPKILGQKCNESN